ncbi:hypothetical protein [Mycetocola sp. 2940]|uniref:hypothetical protein n=1 Tax=Mycetocola sp. 2940 TaxID=3156452 RepID=UPI00339497F3
MIETFRRLPRGPAEVAADGVRVLGLLSIVVALIGWSPLDVAVLALGLLGLVIPRFLGTRPALDIAFGITVLVATWSGLLNLYEAIAFWDILVHFALNGLFAAVLYILAMRCDVIPDPGDGRASFRTVFTLITAFGLASGAVWELSEWVGHTIVDETIFVGYNDTIGDIAAGALGSLLAGLAGHYLTAESRFIPARPPASASI